MEFLSIKEVAQLLEVNEETVRRWIRDEKLPADNLGGRTGYRISKVDFESFVASNQMKSTASFNTKHSILGAAIGAAAGPVGMFLGSAVGGLLGSYINKTMKELSKQNKELPETVQLRNQLVEVKYSLENEKIKTEAKLKQIIHDITTIEDLLRRTDNEINIADERDND